MDSTNIQRGVQSPLNEGSFNRRDDIMSEILVNVSRDPVTESIHRGDIVAVNGEGKIIAYLGDPEKFTYMRSAAKPFQACAVLESGAVDYFGLTERELAVMCGSHYGEEAHVLAVLSILFKIGLDERYLQCGASYSLNEKVTMEYVRKGIEKKSVFHNCSGKHSGMLAMAMKEEFDVHTYMSIENPVQQRILETIADFAEMDKGKIKIGIDGCGVPVHAMPISNMAKAYMKLANPMHAGKRHIAGARKITMVMTGYPEMIAGTNGFDSELIKATRGKLAAKLGADGVYCVGAVGRNIGIAIKMEDGNVRVLSSVVLETLKQLELISDSELAELKHFYIRDIKSSQGDKIGEIRPEFRLKGK